MAIEEAVLELTGTIKELIETLKTEKHVNKAEPEEEKEPLASKRGTSKEKETEQPELEDVRSSLIRLKEATDHETAKSILKQFGVQKVQDLAEKDYQRCIDLCQKEAA